MKVLTTKTWIESTRLQKVTQDILKIHKEDTVENWDWAEGLLN